MDLVIMAAGMGSRFGGLKQIEPIDENNNFIIDYSVFDAIRAGFDRAVFIIKKENFDIFRNTIGKRVENKIKVEYVFQEGLDICPERVKPWGTGHAILCCKNVVKNNFAIINSDDFYGADAFKTAARYLKNLNQNSFNFAVVGYKAKNTLSENGAAKRGICNTKDGVLTDIVESSIEKIGENIIATPLAGGKTKKIDENQTVSMNMFAFSPKIFELLEKDWHLFLKENRNNLNSCEFLIPDVIEKAIKTGASSVKVLDTNAIWYGVTYREDKPKVVQSIKSLVNSGEYPNGLWKNSILKKRNDEQI